MRVYEILKLVSEDWNTFKCKPRSQSKVKILSELTNALSFETTGMFRSFKLL